jgi:hypothetical protein
VLNLLGSFPAGMSAKSINRLVAVSCALRCVPDSSVESGSSGTYELKKYASTFEEWLDKADTDEDALIRRTLLIEVCDKAPKSAPRDRIRDFAKDLHRHATRH